MTALDLAALLGALHEHGVRYVLIGGVAVGAHGYLRATEDVDIVPDSAQDNLDRLIRTLASIDATLPLAGERRFDPAKDAAALRRGRNLTLTTRHGPLDVVQLAAGVPPFAALDREAIDSDLLGIPVRVCSLRHLRQMKEAGGRPEDLLDLSKLPPA